MHIVYRNDASLFVIYENVKNYIYHQIFYRLSMYTCFCTCNTVSNAQHKFSFICTWLLRALMWNLRPFHEKYVPSTSKMYYALFTLSIQIPECKISTINEKSEIFRMNKPFWVHRALIVQFSFILLSPLSKSRSPFADRVFTVCSRFKWESRTFQNFIFSVAVFLNRKHYWPKDISVGYADNIVA